MSGRDGGRPRTRSVGRGSTGRETRARRGTDDRGQAHTLEGVVASLVLFAAVVFALEMTAVTPLSASTSSQHLENQQEATARGILATAAETDALKPAVLSWNASGDTFYDANDLGYYATNPPPNAFGRMLNRSFDSQGIAYNVFLTYRTGPDDRTERRMVYQGQPSDNAVSATWTLTLFDDDELHDAAAQPNGTEIGNTSAFYAPDASASSVYNVFRVEVVVWRI